MTTHPRPTRDQMREHLREHANCLRQDADFVAAHWECDDPSYPYSLDLPWADWTEFMTKTVVPFIELDAEDPAREQALLAEYRQASPAFIMTSMYFMWQRMHQAEDALLDLTRDSGTDPRAD